MLAHSRDKTDSILSGASVRADKSAEALPETRERCAYVRIFFKREAERSST
jgi:hypothetical protein